MTDIAPIGGGLVGRLTPIEQPEAASDVTSGRRARLTGDETKTARAVRGADRVEVSRMASLLNQLRELPDIREDLVRRVRDQIAAGAYDTPERIEGAINGILGEEMR